MKVYSGQILPSVQCPGEWEALNTKDEGTQSWIPTEDNGKPRSPGGVGIGWVRIPVGT